MTQSTCTLRTASLDLAVAGDGGLTLRDRRTAQRLLIAPHPALVLPVIDGVPVSAAGAVVGATPDGLQVRLPDGVLRDLVVTLRAVPGEDAIDVACTFTATAACQLNRLSVLPAGTACNLHDVVNYRNRHHTPATWPELLPTGCSTDTYSTDWQFAPHPTQLLLRRADSTLFCGALDLTTGYGMYLALKDHRVQDWGIDYGTAPHGQALAAGERFAGPRIRWFLRHGEGAAVEAVLGAWTGMLVRAGIITAPERVERPDWWREPLYCTWIDQCFRADAMPPEALGEQTAEAAHPSRRVMTDAFVREAAATIRRERLPFRTILLDEGWNAARGDWQAHPRRFPDFRRLVDDLHAQGLKVVVWWSWAEIEDAVEIPAAHLLAGGRRNRHGARMRDYSSPATQEEYLKPLMRRLFSSEPGCYDLDGVKTDFLADKVHPDLPPSDPAWRGEENWFLRLTRLFAAEMRRHKPDAVHIGCAGDHHLAECIGINRTFDVHSSDPREHLERARMLRATSPGTPVAFDFHNYVDGWDGWFDAAVQVDASLQVGNIMLVKDDRFAAPREPGAAWYAELRRRLG